MVLNSGVVMRVAHVSARLCQYIACNPEILRSDAVLGLIFCLPFQRLFFSLSSYLGYRIPHSNWNRNPNRYPYGESLLYIFVLYILFFFFFFTLLLCLCLFLCICFCIYIWDCFFLLSNWIWFGTSLEGVIKLWWKIFVRSKVGHFQVVGRTDSGSLKI